MKRHEGLIKLSHDHHRGLLLAQLLKKDAPDYKGLPNDVNGKIKYTLEAYEKELFPHFENEENILLPAVRSVEHEEIKPMIERMLDEHVEIKEKIRALNYEGDLIEKMDDLGRTLENHIRFEERELFPAIENILSEEKLLKIKEELDH